MFKRFLYIEDLLFKDNRMKQLQKGNEFNVLHCLVNATQELGERERKKKRV